MKKKIIIIKACRPSRIDNITKAVIKDCPYLSGKCLGRGYITTGHYCALMDNKSGNKNIGLLIPNMKTGKIKIPDWCPLEDVETILKKR